MKIVSKYKAGFAPFTLTVTVETLDELYNLYARLNMSTAAVHAEADRHYWSNDIKDAVSKDHNELLFELMKHMPADTP